MRLKKSLEGVFIMKSLKRTVLTSVLIILISVIFPCSVYANGAAPPSLTLIVYNAPNDLVISTTDDVYGLIFNDGKIGGFIYRFPYDAYYTVWDGEIILKSSSESKSMILPPEAFESYDNYVTLDYKTMELTIGQPAWRVPLIIALRVSFTLIIEGILLFVFDFRKKSDIIAFLIVNIVTQSLLNICIITDSFGSYEMIKIIIIEPLIFIVESIAYCIFLKCPQNIKYKKLYKVGYAAAANFASLFVGGFAIYMMPF